MAQEAIYLLRTHGDIVGAAKCAIRHAVPVPTLAHEVQEEMYKLNDGVLELSSPHPPAETGTQAQAWDEDWDAPSPREVKQETRLYVPTGNKYK